MENRINIFGYWLRSLILVAFVLGAIQALAVTLIADNRTVVTTNDDGVTTLLPPAPFALWNDTSHFSTITPDRFQGLGTGFGELDPLFSVTESIFDVTFSVSVATLIDLSGSLFGEDRDFGLGLATVQLFNGADTTDNVLFGESGGNDVFVPFAFMGTLDPGTYRLIVRSHVIPGGPNTFAQWTFDADFTALPVPVPVVGWLFGVAVLGLVRRKRNGNQR